jgi:HAE1 family hydrophobic/amphiphilic exporter-1
VQVSLERDRAAALSLTAAQVEEALGAAFASRQVSTIYAPANQYQVVLEAQPRYQDDPATLARLYVRAPSGKLVRLDSVASFREQLGPAVIGRFDLQYAATFFASPAIPLGDAVARVREAAAEVLPTGYQVKFIGQAEEFGKTLQNMVFAFSLALVLLYMVLASQFNSFLQPLIVMTAQPLAVVGGLFALWLTGTSLNLISMIGLILLMGLVAKNSILLVDLTNQMREQGRGVEDALREACPIRLRPVLMTSLTVILALLPAALGLGAGADTNRPMAIAVIGGMVSSTLLTLVVVPAVYSLVEQGLRRIQRRSQ